MSIKHEMITVSGTVMYCDGCGKRGPEAAYDNANDVIDGAEHDGWQTGDDEDLCPDCVKAAKPKRKKAARG